MAVWAEISIVSPSEIGGLAWGRGSIFPANRANKRGLPWPRRITAPRFASRLTEIWKIVRDFNSYPVWVSGAGESEIEDRRSGDAVGAIRSVQYKGRHICQRLLALSDVEHSHYEFCGASSLPMTGFKATLRIFEIVDGGGAFVEWWADFRLRGGTAGGALRNAVQLVRRLARIAPYHAWRGNLH